MSFSQVIPKSLQRDLCFAVASESSFGVQPLSEIENPASVYGKDRSYAEDESAVLRVFLSPPPSSHHILVSALVQAL